LSARLAVKVTLRARQEIRVAAAWWRENRAAAPSAISEDLEQAFELVAVHPEIGAVARNTRLGRERVLSAALVEEVGGFRNLLVHADLDLDPGRVWEILQRAPDRFERFAREVSAWLASVGTPMDTWRSDGCMAVAVRKH